MKKLFFITILSITAQLCGSQDTLNLIIGHAAMVVQLAQQNTYTKTPKKIYPKIKKSKQPHKFKRQSHQQNNYPIQQYRKYS